MEQSKANPLVRLAAEHAHEGHALTTIEMDGQPVWLAAQISTALDYQKVDQVVTNVTGPWSDELVEGTDYQVLRGAELAALKAAAPGLVDPRAPSVMVLTESGVNLVALLSRQPKARDLRRWLAAEVLPSIRRTGSYNRAHPLAVRGHRPAQLPVVAAADLLQARRPLSQVIPMGGLKAGERSLLRAIIEHAELDPATGELVCTASMDQLGREVGWAGRRRAQQVLNRLADKGRVLVEWRPSTTNRITVLVGVR
jgi:prophage antirepressor-like protein